MRKIRNWRRFTQLSGPYLVALFLLGEVRSSSAQPAGLAITSPSNGQRFSVGDTITVIVTSPAGLQMDTLQVTGGFFEAPIAFPVTLSVPVLANGKLGVGYIDASGYTIGGVAVQAAPVEIVVEKAERPTALSAEDSSLVFRTPGYDLPVRFVARFADGSRLTVNESTKMSYTSSNLAVAAVDAVGTVSSIGVGAARITATYDGEPPLSVDVAVRVDAPALSSEPPILQFGSSAVGVTTVRTVTLTNRRSAPIAVRELSALGEFTVQSDCLQRSPLQPGGTCSAVVSYTPSAAGPVRSVLKIVNDFEGPGAGVPLFGEGLGLRASSTTLGSSVNPSVLGQPVTLTATVADAAGSTAPAPAGEVAFTSGTTTLGAAALTGAGVASAPVPALSVGGHVLTASYSGDSAYGPSTSAPLTQVVRYAAAGSVCAGGPGRQILPPVNADGTSVFRQGRTVPAKFRVCDASGQSVGTAGVVQDFRLTQVISGTTSDVNENVPSTAPDTAFRWDAADQQWIFNISTAGQEAQKTYVYTITLNDGTTLGFRYGLR